MNMKGLGQMAGIRMMEREMLSLLSGGPATGKGTQRKETEREKVEWMALVLPPTKQGKARRREGDAAGEGKRFRRSRFFFCFSSKTKKAEDGLRCVLSEGNTLFRPLAYWDSSLRALPALFFSARESAGNNRKERGPCSCCVRPLLSQWGSRFGIY